MNFIIRILFSLLIFSMTMPAAAQNSDSKAKSSKAKNEKLKAEQKKAYLRQQKAFRKKHYDMQSKEVKKRMNSNQKNTDSYYSSQRKPLFRRIFPEKLKQDKNSSTETDNQYKDTRSEKKWKKNTNNNPKDANNYNGNRRGIFRNKSKRPAEASSKEVDNYKGSRSSSGKKFKTQANNNPKDANKYKANRKSIFSRIFRKKYKH